MDEDVTERRFERVSRIADAVTGVLTVMVIVWSATTQSWWPALVGLPVTVIIYGVLAVLLWQRC
ncbi:hypothetical protein [Kineococcus aurantiacus]|uniref:hypothetical protein n=1 Tax=Kineococcus aurantiacus TaxID=37633 RepID=UPI0031DBCEBD